MSNYKNGLATRAALYQSARACFYRKGYFDTSIQDMWTPPILNWGFLCITLNQRKQLPIWYFANMSI